MSTLNDYYEALDTALVPLTEYFDDIDLEEFDIDDEYDDPCGCFTGAP